MFGKSPEERALELSKDGKHRSIAEITMTLLEEGYENAHSDLSDPAITKRLRENIKAARSDR